MDFTKKTRECVQQIHPYVPGKPIEEVQRELGITSVIKMASNENPLGPSTEVRQALVHHLDKINYYPDANAFYLKEALAKELDVPAEMIVFGNGSDDVNKVLGETLLNPEDEVIIPQPTFSQYEYITLLMGAKPVFVRGEGLEHDLGAMLKAVTSKTKMVFICNPNNPTGTIVRKDELVRFLTALPKGITVVIDEAYGEFVTDPDFLSGLDCLKQGFTNVVVYRTFSKIYGLAGLRLGYAVADPTLTEQMNRVREPFNVNLLAQIAGIAALNSKMHLNLSKELVKSGRSYFYEQLDAMGVKYLQTQANFILIHCGKDSRDIYEFLLQNGIIVRATHSFGLPEYIRVTFGTAEQNERFFRVFKQTMSAESL